MPRSDAASSVVKHPNASEFEAAGFRVKRGMTINRRFLKKLNEYNSHMLRYLTTPDAAFIGQTPRYRQCVKDISICSLARTAHCVKRGMTMPGRFLQRLNRYNMTILYEGGACGGARDEAL